MAEEFDPKSPKNRQIVQYLASQQALIADAFSPSRMTIRKLLVTMGMKGKNIETAEDYQEAEQKIQDFKPKIVFCDYTFGAKGAFDLLKIHRNQYLIRSEAIFVVTSDRISPVIANRVEDEPLIDLFVTRPFTYATLSAQFLTILRPKVMPSQAWRNLELGKVLMAENQFEEAIKVFIKTKLENVPVISVQAWINEGLARKKLNQLDDAKACFMEALRLDPKNYRALVSLFEIFSETQNLQMAHEVAIRLVRDHPVRPNKIPAFVRVAVMLGHYPEILKLYDFYQTLEGMDDLVINSMTAGLLFCAKQMMKQDKKSEAMVYLRKAHAAAKNRPAMLKEILVAMLSVGPAGEVGALISSAPEPVKNSVEVRIAEYEILSIGSSPSRVIEMGMALIREGLKSKRIFEILIQTSLGLKRRQQVIDDLVVEACRAFPEEQGFFEGLIAEPRATASG